VEVVVREVWRRALAGQPAPPPPVVLGLAVVAAVLVLAPVAWPRTRHVVTLAHEGAHGLAAVLTGRRLAGIRLHSDTSGLTVSSGRPRGLGMVVTLAAGYLGPGLFGLGAAFLLGAGHAVDVLWLVLVLLVLLLVQIRNWFGFCSVLVTGTVLLAASWWLPDRGQSVLAYLVTWFLLMAAPRPVLELAAQRRRRGVRGTPDSDADQLARLTGVPAAVWIALQGVGPVDQEGGENFNGPGGALLGQAVHRQPEVMLVPLGGCSMSRLRQVQLTSGRSNWICTFAKW